MIKNDNYTLYQIICNFKNPETPNQQKLEYVYFLIQIPLFIICFVLFLYRFKKQLPNEEYYDQNKKIKTNNKLVEYLMRLYLIFFIVLNFYFTFSYIFSGTKIAEDNDEDYKDETISGVYNYKVKDDKERAVHFTFLVAGIFGTYLYFKLSYYPWFLITPFIFIPVYILYNTILLKYVFFFVSAFTLYGLSQKPYVEREEYSKFGLFIKRSLFVLLGIWVFNIKT